jgi:hypothetical protein
MGALAARFPSSPEVPTMFILWRWALAAAVLFPANLIADTAKPAIPLIRSDKSGAWSAASTWEGGKAPSAGAKVQIRKGHTVTYDVQRKDVIRSIHVAGVLAFAHDKDTWLNVGLIKIQPGDDASEDGFDCDAHAPKLEAGQPRPALDVGTPNQPIQAKHTAVIRLHAVAGLDKGSCPAIVCCGGRMNFHGALLSRTWLKLGATAKKGDETVTIDRAVTGWRVGDTILITGTNARTDFRSKWQTEERVIRAIEGKTLTVDKPLAYDHLGSGEYRGEVANISRNVIVESADPAGARGHTMYHKHSAGSISYAEFRHLGKEGVLGRYALHFHLVGDTMRGSYVLGASIWESKNRWLTIHGTNYLIVRDCVGYRSVGHGFFLEDGTEVYNVLDRNLAIEAKRGKRLPKQPLAFDDNEGAGFWWANSHNTFTRNTSCENARYGYRYEATPSSASKLIFPIQGPDGTRKPIDIRKLPFVRFDGNESHNEGLYGINLGEGVNRVGPDVKHPFIMRDTKIWSLHYAFRPQVPSLLVENMKIWKAAYGVYHPNYDNHVYRDMYIGQTNTEPFNRGHDDDSAQYGKLTVDGLTFDKIYSGSQMPLIQISDDNKSGTAESHFRNVKTTDWKGDKNRALVNLGGGPRPTPTTEKGVPIYFHDHFGSGRTAKIISTKSKELKSDGLAYRSEPLLTGDESRVAEVKGIVFPKLLEPVDDLPPTTVITHVRREGAKWIIRGTTADNGIVKRVTVNGREATKREANFSEWEVALDASAKPLKLKGQAEDMAGNVEKKPHILVVD